VAQIDDLKSAAASVQRSGLARFFAKYAADRADDYAALIAFTGLFSVFPLIGALLALLGLLLRDEELLAQVTQAISSLFPSDLTELLSFIQETRRIGGVLGVASLFGLLWSGSAMFGTMARAFDVFYGVPERGLLAQRLMAIAMIFVFVLLIVISIGASSAGAVLIALSSALPAEFQDPGLFELLLGWGLALASGWLLFLVMYWVVPNVRQGPGAVWRGALFAAVLFALLNQLFPTYLRFFGGGFATYKTIGLFLLLMTWFYLLARILVLGAELNAFLRPVHPAVPPLTAMAGAAAGLTPEPPSRRSRLLTTALETALLLGLLVALGRRTNSSPGSARSSRT
jgi:membrane protein